MTLRGQLLTYFIAIILVVLVVFGLNAYQIASDSTIDTERYLLSGIVRQKSLALAAAYRENPSLDHLQAYIGNDKADNDHTLLLINGGSEIILPRKIDAKVIDIRNVSVDNITASDANDGYHVIDGQLYIWAKASVPQTPYKLIHLFRSGQEMTRPLESLAARMAVTGLIIVWVAVWMALIISTAVARRLKSHTDALEYNALHDDLTDLPNRILLQELLEREIRNAKRKDKSIALIILGLNRFKEINDTLGHHIGDLLLRQISRRLLGIVREADTVVRFGGDQFILLLPMSDISHSKTVVDHIQQVIEHPISLEELTLEVEASLGIALYPDHGSDATTLIRRAEVAMYAAKSSGDLHMVYDPDKDPHSLRRLTLTRELRQAIETDELLLHYQPKVDIRTGRILSVEALVRWQHPNHGLLLPGDFVPVAEQSSIIKPLTFWVLFNALNQCAIWRQAGMPVVVSVNLSTRVLHDIQLPTQIASNLKVHDLDPDWLALEITETAIMRDPTRAMEILKQLDATGVQLSIDDFGTGYTSLAYLKQLPVDEIKIDKSFVIDMLHNANDAIIVRTIIDLAHNMGRTVVAEGVENRKIYDVLAARGCDTAQGHYLSRPLPAKELERWMRESPWSLPDHTKKEISQPKRSSL